MAKPFFGKEIQAQAAFQSECGLALRARFVDVRSLGRDDAPFFAWMLSLGGYHGGNNIPAKTIT